MGAAGVVVQASLKDEDDDGIVVVVLRGAFVYVFVFVCVWKTAYSTLYPLISRMSRYALTSTTCRAGMR